MNKHALQSQVKSSGMAYLMWFLLGAHYAYFNKWGLQIAYWLTLGGLGFWALYDLFTMSGKVDKYNAPIFEKLEKIEKDEKDQEHKKHMEMMAAASGNKSSNE
jgi:hypothetical protein